MRDTGAMQGDSMAQTGNGLCVFHAREFQGGGGEVIDFIKSSDSANAKAVL